MAMDGTEQSFVEHILELKTRLLHSVLSILIIFTCMFPYLNEIYAFVAEPIINTMPKGASIISVGVISPFLTPLKMGLIFSLYLAIPYLAYQIWLFVAPALYKNEKRIIIPLVISSAILFYTGVMFSFFIVLPVIFEFLSGVAPTIVSQSPDIQNYLDFVLKVSFACGVAFEVPIATILLIKFNAVSAETLKKNRAYVVLGAFVVGMVLTPPDIISQVMIAIPMWLLFEVGLIASPYFKKVNEEDEKEDQMDDDMEDDLMDAEMDEIESEFDKLDKE